MIQFVSFAGAYSPIRQRAIIGLGEILRAAILEALKLEDISDVSAVQYVEVPYWLLQSLRYVQGVDDAHVKALGRPVRAYDAREHGGDVIIVHFADSVQAAGSDAVATHQHTLMMMPEPPTDLEKGIA